MKTRFAARPLAAALALALAPAAPAVAMQFEFANGLKANLDTTVSYGVQANEAGFVNLMRSLAVMSIDPGPLPIRSGVRVSVYVWSGWAGDGTSWSVSEYGRSVTIRPVGDMSLNWATSEPCV